jgi:hypothetical protein
VEKLFLRSGSEKSCINKQKELDMAKIRFIVLAAFVLTALILSASCTAEKDLARLQDRVAIDQLMFDYIQALDSRDADRYAALFTPDGQFLAGEMEVKGREALKKMIEDAGQMGSPPSEDNEAENVAAGESPSGRMYHVVTNPHIELIDENHARFHAYWMGVFTSGGVTSAGREVNELEKIDGQWLIRVRDVDPQD